jgi:hypothetical protein
MNQSVKMINSYLFLPFNIKIQFKNQLGNWKFNLKTVWIFRLLYKEFHIYY